MNAPKYYFTVGLVRPKSRTVANRRIAILLVVPLLVFMMIGFFLPVIIILVNSVQNREVADAFPTFKQALTGWQDRNVLPPDSVFSALASDIVLASENGRLQLAARRLNYEVEGSRSLLLKTARALSETPLMLGKAVSQQMISIDPRWGDTSVWNLISRNTQVLTGYYFIRALDMERGSDGTLVFASKQQALYLDVFLRTFQISLLVTCLCLVAGFPVAFLLANLPSRYASPLMILVLLPFWTSVLVRTAGWIIVLQKQGLVNNFLLWLGLIEKPLDLVFNRVGVYVAMTHILLPFMVLPIYSTMRAISPTYMKAAISLGSSWSVAFRRVYLPLTLPGISAGCVLVFISAIGYYITPALVGGGGDQLISYFVAYFVNDTLNWGQAAALGVLLLAFVLIVYGFFGRLLATRITVRGA